MYLKEAKAVGGFCYRYVLSHPENQRRMIKMFDPFKFWDEMLDIYNETVARNKDEVVIEYITMEVEIPSHLEEEFTAMVDNWLEQHNAG